MAKELPSSVVRWRTFAILFVIGACVYFLLDVRLTINPLLLKHLRTFAARIGKGHQNITHEDAHSTTQPTKNGQSTYRPTTPTSPKGSLTSSKPAYTTPQTRKKTPSEKKIEFIKKKVLEKKYKVILLDLLKKFLEIAEELKLIYIIYGGSLIGSWRHHGMVPWDDDIDVLVNISQKGALLKKLAQLKPEYIGAHGDIIKFYSSKSPEKIKGASHRWPFIDICFFEENKKEIFDIVNVFRKYKLPKKMIFPLHKRPFEDLEVNAPRDSLGVIGIQYYWIKPNLCSTWNYDHRREKSGLERTVVPCKVLKDEFPFVHRKFVNGTMVETLKVGQKVIHTKYLKELKSSLTPPY